MCIRASSKIIIWILAALSPILCAVTYPFLPQQVPMHWDINGTVSVSYTHLALIDCENEVPELKITPKKCIRIFLMIIF